MLFWELLSARIGWTASVLSNKNNQLMDKSLVEGRLFPKLLASRNWNFSLKVVRGMWNLPFSNFVNARDCNSPVREQLAVKRSLGNSDAATQASVSLEHTKASGLVVRNITTGSNETLR